MEKFFPEDTVATFLGQTALFRGVDVAILLELAEQSRQERVQEGTTVQRAGMPVRSLGLLLKGAAGLLLVDAATGRTSHVEELAPGDLFGEVGLLLGAGNPLSVVAKKESYLLHIERQALTKVLKTAPSVGLALAKTIAARFVKVAILGALGDTSAPQDAQGAGIATTGPAPQSSAGIPGGGNSSIPTGNVIPWVEVGTYDLTPELLGTIPRDLIRKHRMLPLQVKDRTLVVGMVNPRSVEALSSLRKTLHSMDPQIVAISADDFAHAFVRLKLGGDPNKATEAARRRRTKVLYRTEQDDTSEAGQLVIGDEIKTLFDRILVTAVERGASDIHIEPGSTSVIVRFRVEGSLEDFREVVTPAYAAPLVARIKVLAELDIAERRLPQDGRITAVVDGQEVNMRINTLPVVRGEKVVIRLIDPSNIMRPVHQIFLHPDEEKAARAALGEPYGAIIVAGPTGSGKSSTLYSMLNERRKARPDMQVVTVEDPVEYLLSGVTQVQVNPRIGLDFATVLRGLMRQDPDTIMIGELRDSETTTIMVEAALTGHLVLTSIHGSNAAAVIQRIQHLGTDPILLSQSMELIIVQRLAKRLCPQCVQLADVSPALIDSLAARGVIQKVSTTKLPKAVGCEHCSHSGYLGRVAVQEIFHFDEQLRVALAAGAKPADLLAMATERKRYVSFAQAAAFLMARRVLSPSEALLAVAG